MKKTFQIATPISHLFRKKDIREKIIRYSDILEERDHSIDIGKNDDFIYHCELNIVAKWSDKEIGILQKIRYKDCLKLISFHILSRYQKNNIQNNAFIGIGRPYSIKEMEENCRENCKIVRKIFGKEMTILVENNNYLSTDAYEKIIEGDFISKIVGENNIFLLLDIAHAMITAINKKIDIHEYFNSLPLKKCKQIHLSKYFVKKGNALDAHETLEEDDWKFFKEILELTRNVEYVSIEYYKNADKLVEQLIKLKKIQNE